jgi:hypothetical protein
MRRLRKSGESSSSGAKILLEITIHYYFERQNWRRRSATTALSSVRNSDFRLPKQLPLMSCERYMLGIFFVVSFRSDEAQSNYRIQLTICIGELSAAATMSSQSFPVYPDQQIQTHKSRGKITAQTFRGEIHHNQPSEARKTSF